MDPTPVILLHGLGSHPWTLAPLAYCIRQRFQHVHNLKYPVDNMEFHETLQFVDDLMATLVDKTKSVILIGQSMGGVVANNMHKLGWDVKFAIYIGSPLKGARLLTQLNAVLPTAVRNLLFKKPYGILMEKAPEEAPPHPYHCITMGWFHTKFDGCVYQDEATLDVQHHTHLAAADHRTVFFNPRLWITVNNLIP